MERRSRGGSRGWSRGGEGELEHPGGRREEANASGSFVIQNLLSVPVGLHPDGSAAVRARGWLSPNELARLEASDG